MLEIQFPSHVYQFVHLLWLQSLKAFMISIFFFGQWICARISCVGALGVCVSVCPRVRVLSPLQFTASWVADLLPFSYVNAT